MGHKPFSSHAGEVLMSTETNNLLLSTLSAGIVGVGDPIGSESATNQWLPPLITILAAG
jgi:hypothetical protein